MTATAKVFSTGNSQAVRLPKAFRVDTSEMWINKNEITGEITLTPKPSLDEWDEFFTLLHAQPKSKAFLPARDDAPRPDPFEGWK
jgi:antitoxin VapB